MTVPEHGPPTHKGGTAPFEDGDATQTSVLGYYLASNRPLFDTINEWVAGSANTQTIYAIGRPGLGKSFIRRSIASDLIQRKIPVITCELRNGLIYSSARPAKTDLGSLSAGFALARNEPDLVWRDNHSDIPEHVFNSLPLFRGPQLQDILVCLTSQSPPLATKVCMLIDDLDEIHPKSATAALSAIDTFCKNQGTFTGGVCFIIFGRPEGFSGPLTDSTVSISSRPKNNPLNPPEYRTTGDLSLLVGDSRQFTKARGGHEIAAGTEENLIALARQYSWLQTTIQDLDLLNYLVQRAETSRTLDESRLKRDILEAMFERGHQKHQRPTITDSRYYRLFEDIAAHYAAVTDVNGFFDVGFLDMVPVIDENFSRVGEVSVRDALDRSGLVFRDPADLRKARYRFSPVWLHGYLVAKYSERNTKWYHRIHLQWIVPALWVGVTIIGVIARKRRFSNTLP